MDGLDGIYVGPSDLSLSLDLAGAGDRDHLQEVISSVIRRALAVGMPVGVHTADGVQASRYAGQGTTIVTAAMDDTVLTDAVRNHLALVREANDVSRS